jgi:hypothetical protein
MRLSSAYPRLLPYAQSRARAGVVPNFTDVILAGRRNVSTSRTSAEATATEATADADAAAAKLLAKSPATLHLPKPIFPWRSETELLPRFIPGTPEYAKDIRVPATFRSIVAFCFLNVPWYQLLFTGNAHEEDIAHSTSWAFAQAVAGVVSDVYQVPLADIALDDKVNFQFPPPDGGAVLEGDDKNKDKSSEGESMLARPLRNLFESAHESGKSQLRIRLEMQPKSVMFHSMFALPFVSRAAVEKDPSLLEKTYRNMRLMRSNPQEGFRNVYKGVEEQQNKNGKLSTTVEVQVLVECDEIFQVVDLNTGVVLQGHEDGLVRSVVHLVRMEKTVETYDSNDKFPYYPDIRQGNWQITDIDDLLGPKKWYLM